MSAKRLFDLHQELQRCQCRLGTSAEEPRDFEQVLHLAHQINNVITAEYLRQVTENPLDAARPQASVVREWLKGKGVQPSGRQ